MIEGLKAADAMYHAALNLLFHVRGVEAEKRIKITGSDELDIALLAWEANPGARLLALLLKFYEAWNRCESNRGCYSCCHPHDMRCHSLWSNPEPCTCGRDELDKLEKQIDEALDESNG